MFAAVLPCRSPAHLFGHLGSLSYLHTIDFTPGEFAALALTELCHPVRCLRGLRQRPHLTYPRLKRISRYLHYISLIAPCTVRCRRTQPPKELVATSDKHCWLALDPARCTAVCTRHNLHDAASKASATGRIGAGRYARNSCTGIAPLIVLSFCD